MRHRDRQMLQAALICAIVAGGTRVQAQDAQAPKAPVWPGLKPSGTVLLPNGWSLKPAGRQAPLGDLPVILAENPKASVLAILHAGYGDHEVWLLDTENGKTISKTVLPASFSGLCWSPDGTKLYVGGGFDDVIYGFDHEDGLLSKKVVFAYPAKAAEVIEEEVGRGRVNRAIQRVPAGLAVSGDGKTLYVANAFGHSFASFDTASRKLIKEIELGVDTYPYGVALDESRNRVYVSLWGAAKVAIIDQKTLAVAGEYLTQEHPNEMITAKKGEYLFVANANRNTVTVFDTDKGKAVETINTAIAPLAPSGSTPSALSLSIDENVLFVANANTNDIAAFNVKEPGESTPLGFIPVGWYPTSVRASRDGKSLWVTNGKGGSSKANRDGPMPGSPGENRTRQYIGGLFQGTLSTIPIPSPKQMAEFSQTVYACSPLNMTDPAGVTGPELAKDNPIPRKVGDASPIKHCIYIVKENRTYDQVLGDMPEGNGEPSICLFPEKITPNQHAIAREFVLLDNFYVDAEVSADGHEWSMGAYATDFVERTWPLSYRGDRRVPYPAEGNFAIATPAGGYLWDRAAAKNVSYRSYGEFIDNGKTPDDPSTTTVKSLEGHFDPKFRGYDLSYPDVKRTDRFLEELAEFEKAGEMPQLIILRLGNDHTAGTTPGRPTVQAMVADNDLALGRFVEGVSKSKFWPTTAIFVIEDDAQNGSDHVDAHRTTAYAISPYIKRKSVDSTMYSTSSILRTMELILGLDPMSQFDASARPMAAAFTGTPDLTPYTAKPAQIDLDERNAKNNPGAAASLKLNLEKEDQADDLVFNEIIWKAVKGEKSPMPAPVRAAFVVPRVSAADKVDD